MIENRRALVLHPDPALRAHIKRKLRSRGWTVNAFDDRDVALTVLAEAAHAVAFVYVSGEESEGYEDLDFAMKLCRMNRFMKTLLVIGFSIIPVEFVCVPGEGLSERLGAPRHLREAEALAETPAGLTGETPPPTPA